MRRGEIVVDSFAGGGGASLGIEWALGKSPDIAINHDEEALAMHVANHPNTRHLLEDVWKADLEKLLGKRKVGALWASPDCKHFSAARGSKPVEKSIRSLAWVVCKWAEKFRPRVVFLENVREFCFPGETAVLTKQGMRALSTIVPGDFVMTHNSRWRRVTKVALTRKKVVSLKGYGNTLIRCSENHEFYCRRLDAEVTQSGSYGRHRTQMLEPEWLSAERIREAIPTAEQSKYDLVRRGVAWATPKKFPRYPMRLPSESVPYDVAVPEFFYVLGRWLGDGWIRKKRGVRKNLRICCAKHESEFLQANLEASGMGWQKRESRDSVDVFECTTSAGFVRWLTRHFGEHAHHKTLPAWLFSSDVLLRQALADGYADSDGWAAADGDNSASAVSVSRNLAVGMKLLLQSLGQRASFSEQAAPRVMMIEGSLVSCARSYMVTWKTDCEWTKGWETERHIWGRVREVSQPSSQEEFLYDITVEEDKSFIADGQVVHNCDWGPTIPVYRCNGCDWKGTEGQASLLRSRLACPRCNSVRLKQTSDEMPDPSKKGITFKRWVGRLRNLGYDVQWRVLDASHYGAPTRRKRLFLIARNDGEFIYWPTQTHADPKEIAKHPEMRHLKPWRTAAECIDWNLPCPSIFTRKRPLVEKTMRRIALGIKRYVLDADEPFMVNMSHGGKVEPLGKPLSTVATEKRGCRALVVPIVSQYHHSKADDSRCQEVDNPLNTLDTQPRYALVSAFVAKHFGGMVGVPATEPLPTTTQKGCQNQIVAVTMVQTGYGERDGQSPRCLDIEEPLGTVVAGGTKHAAVAATLVRHFGNSAGHPVDTPAPTSTGANKSSLVAANLIHLNHGDKQWSGVDEPLRTVTSNNHAALVYSFMIRYFGTAIGQHCTEPLYTVTGKDRFGLVIVQVGGEPYVIVDIGMRMLTPRELARAQGFPDDYVLTGTKTSQVAKIGNSVPPQVVDAIVRANLSRRMVKPGRARVAK